MGNRHDAGGAVNAEPVVPLVGRARLRGVYPDPDAHLAPLRPFLTRQRALRRDGCPCGLVRALEGEEERVPLRVDFRTAVVLRRRAKDPPMLDKELAVSCT